MTAKTHGQPAVTTSIGKELNVFAERLKKQIKQLIWPFGGPELGAQTSEIDPWGVFDKESDFEV